MWNELSSKLQSLRQEGLYRSLMTAEGVSFDHNDYLGLSTDPIIIEAGVRALRDFGAGSRGSRLLGGNLPIHLTTEERIAEFFGAPSATLFSTGYLANLAAVASIAECHQVIASDEKIHASLIDAIRLTGKPKHILPHQRWDLLPSGLMNERTLCVAESLYSMDGDFAELESLRKLQQGRGVFVLLDEAHAAGVFEKAGRGMSEGKVDWDRTAVTVTFGKAFGCSGAAVLGNTTLKEWLINRARPFIYTTAMGPAVAAMIQASLEVVAKANGKREELWSRATRVREILGVPSTGLAARSPIVPVPIPGDDRALRLAQSMREFGVELKAIRYPTVARGEERIRVSIHLGTSWETTERMAKELVKRWTEFTSQA